MPDIYLRAGEASPQNVRLRDTTTADAGGTITGNAALVSDPSVLVATGTLIIGGTTSLTSDPSVLVASGTLTVSGTAAITSAASVLSATGVVGISGTSTLTNADSTLSATGAVVVGGTSSLTSAASVLSATGGVLVGGSASLTSGASLLTASGAILVIGSATLISDASLLEASGTVGGGTLPEIFGTAYLVSDDSILYATGIAEASRVFGKLKGKNPYGWSRGEEAELKLSEMLANQLQVALIENKTLLQANATLSGAVDKIIGTVEVALDKPPIDPAKKAVLMERLDLARQAKEEKRLAKEAFENQRLKNLAKARRKQARMRAKG